MNSLNSILLEGNLTRAPEIKNVGSSKICTFSIATNRSYKKGDSWEKEVSYFDIETWSGLAERCNSELEKGRGVRVVGRLKQERWKDSDGKDRSKIKIVAEHVEFKPKFSENKQNENDGFIDDNPDESIPF